MRQDVEVYNENNGDNNRALQLSNQNDMNSDPNNNLALQPRVSAQTGNAIVHRALWDALLEQTRESEVLRMENESLKREKCERDRMMDRVFELENIQAENREGMGRPLSRR